MRRRARRCADFCFRLCGRLTNFCVEFLGADLTLQVGDARAEGLCISRRGRSKDGARRGVAEADEAAVTPVAADCIPPLWLCALPPPLRLLLNVLSWPSPRCSGIVGVAATGQWTADRAARNRWASRRRRQSGRRRGRTDGGAVARQENKYSGVSADHLAVQCAVCCAALGHDGNSGAEMVSETTNQGEKRKENSHAISRHRRPRARAHRLVLWPDHFRGGSQNRYGTEVMAVCWSSSVRRKTICNGKALCRCRRAAGSPESRQRLEVVRILFLFGHLLFFIRCARDGAGRGMVCRRGGGRLAREAGRPADIHPGVV